MSRAYTEKKAAIAVSSQGDMHPADICAALRKAGTSLRRLSLANGYYETTVARATTHQYPIGERIIADALGVHPMTLWPSRYHTDGTSTRPSSRRGLHRKGARHPHKSTSAPKGRHVNVGGAG